MLDADAQKNLVNRVKALISTPKTEWPVIAEESASVADIYKNYLIVLVAIPVAARFLRMSIIGIGGPLGIYRVPFFSGLVDAVIAYGLYLAGIFIVALIIDALAPSFGGTRNQLQAFKTAAYSGTASYVASAAVIIPFLGWLIALAGSIYSLYLFYLGLPITMKSPEDRALPYAVVVILGAAVFYILIGLVMGIGGRGIGAV